MKAYKLSYEYMGKWKSILVRAQDVKQAFAWFAGLFLEELEGGEITNMNIKVI